MPRKHGSDFKAAAESLAASLPLSENNAALACVDKQKGIMGVACSGGVDSVALALFLYARRKGKIALLHYNHGLRKGAANKDAAFVGQLAKKLGVAFYCQKAPALKKHDEALLRKLRFSFFEKTCRTHNIKMLAFGHHALDVVETMLLRLIRGSAHIAAPKAVQPWRGLFLLRPLLEMKKEALQAALKQTGVPWREDASNLKTDYLRNRLRLGLLDELKKALAPRALEDGFLRSHRFLSEDDAALGEWLDRLLGKRFEKKKSLAFGKLKDFPSALTRRALRAWLDAHELGGIFDAGGFDALLDILNEGKQARVSAGANGFLSSDGKNLFLKKAPPAKKLRGEKILKGTIKLSTGACMSAEKIALSAALKRKIFSGKIPPVNEVFLDPKAATHLVVRAWKAGDRYRPLGAPGTKKVQDCFTDAKIPAMERNALPVVYNKKIGAILWVACLPPAHAARLSPGATRALRLTYKP